MIRSMTAFARHELQGDWGSIVWEIRSVNHRYLETYFRLPEDFRALETKLRDLAQKQLGRGKLDCQLRFQSQKQAQDTLSINRTLAQSVIETCRMLEEDMMRNPDRVSALDVLAWPGVVEETAIDSNVLQQQALAGFKATLDDLITGRSAEGERIHAMLSQRCTAITDIVAAVRERRPQVLAAQREKWQTRLAELASDSIDEGRLEQELAMIAQRLDVDEELDRLDSHLTEMNNILGRKDPVGRRLDFLMQEFNREANTLSSKSNDAETTKHAVELKVLIEQMREQVQNVE